MCWNRQHPVFFEYCSKPACWFSCNLPFFSQWIFSCAYLAYLVWGLDSLHRLLNCQALIEKKKEASCQHKGSRNRKAFWIATSQNNSEQHLKIQAFAIPRFFLQTPGASWKHYGSSSWVKPSWQPIRWVVAQLSEQPVIAWIGLQILKEVVLQECFPGLDPSSSAKYRVSSWLIGFMMLMKMLCLKLGLVTSCFHFFHTFGWCGKESCFVRVTGSTSSSYRRTMTW